MPIQNTACPVARPGQVTTARPSRWPEFAVPAYQAGHLDIPGARDDCAGCAICLTMR
jgi:hypothetical protein